MERLIRWNNAIAKGEGAVLSLCLFFMIAIAFLQVVMRNFFSSGFVWADLIVRNLMLWVGFFGATLATKQGTNLTIDILSKSLPPRLKHWVAILISLFAMTICGALAKAAVDFVRTEAESGSEFLAGIPLWWTQLIIPATFVLIFFHLLVRLIFQLAGREELVK